jgi:hypothetical protein
MRMLLVAGVALVVVATAGAAPPPPQLFGTWIRTVSKRDVVRADAKKIKPGSVWKLVVAESKSSLRSSSVTRWTGTIVPANATLVHIELGSEADLYGWRVAGHTLVLAKKYDPDADRSAVLAGAWLRH